MRNALAALVRSFGVPSLTEPMVYGFRGLQPAALVSVLEGPRAQPGVRTAAAGAVVCTGTHLPHRPCDDVITSPPLVMTSSPPPR